VFGYAESMQGKLISAARALLGWSQEHLAQQADVSRQTLVSLERDTGNPTRTSERAVVAALEAEGVSFEESPHRIGVFLKRKSD
jgi:DNA-binding XRE family transcriptional regulator